MVIDTNLILSALVFAGGRTAALRTAWQTGRCSPLASQATAAELIRVLAYPKFRLTPTDREELLADYLPCATTVRMPVPRPPSLRSPKQPPLPICRDPNDQLFIELAAVGKAQLLVTGDRDLRVLSPRFDGRIVDAETLLQRLS